MVLKYCIVPDCPNTSITTPQKTFLNIPYNTQVRQQWCKLLNLDYINDFFSRRAKRFVCEDHFELEKDIKNYLEWKVIGTHPYLKQGVLPHIFKCQKNNKKDTYSSNIKIEKKDVKIEQQNSVADIENDGGIDVNDESELKHNTNNLVNEELDNYEGQNTEDAVKTERIPEAYLNILLQAENELSNNNNMFNISDQTLVVNSDVIESTPSSSLEEFLVLNTEYNQPHEEEKWYLMHDTIDPKQENVDAIQENVDPLLDNVDPLLENVDPVLDNVDPTQEIVDPLLENVDPAHENVDPAHENVDPAHENVDPTQQYVNPMVSDVRHTKDEFDPIENEDDLMEDEFDRTEDEFDLSEDEDDLEFEFRRIEGFIHEYNKGCHSNDKVKDEKDTGVKFKCEYCVKRFSSNLLLKEHSKIHNKKDMFLKQNSDMFKRKETGIRRRRERNIGKTLKICSECDKYHLM